MNAELVEEHLGLVRMVAHRFISKNRNLEYDDLFQVGCIGLIKAVDRYDATRDCTFSTFAVYAINGEIMNYLRDHLHSLRVPRRVYVLAKQTLRFGLEESDVLEIAETLNCTIGEAEQAKELAQVRVVSLDKPINTDGESDLTLQDEIPTNSDFSELEAVEWLDNLTEHERTIVKMKVYGLKQKEIAALYGIHQQSVTRRMKNIRNKLKKAGVAI